MKVLTQKTWVYYTQAKKQITAFLCLLVEIQGSNS
jgi:hypothetical protein